MNRSAPRPQRFAPRLVLLPYFGPGVNGDMPTVGAHKELEVSDAA